MGFLNKLFTELFTEEVDEVFPNIDKSFNVLFVADTHGSLRNHLDELEELLENFTLFELQAVIFLGDVSLRDIEILRAYIPDLNEISYGVLGNHDNFGDLEKAGIKNLDGQIVNINGLTFGGFGGSIKYKNSDAPLLTDEESLIKADNLERVDIFITHDGPKNESKDVAHSGLLGITKYIFDKQPKYHFYGHLHKHIVTTERNTTSICEYFLSVYKFSLDGCKKLYKN